MFIILDWHLVAVGGTAKLTQQSNKPLDLRNSETMMPVIDIWTNLQFQLMAVAEQVWHYSPTVSPVALQAYNVHEIEIFSLAAGICDGLRKHFSRVIQYAMYGLSCLSIRHHCKSVCKGAGCKDGALNAARELWHRADTCSTNWWRSSSVVKKTSLCMVWSHLMAFCVYAS